MFLLAASGYYFVDKSGLGVWWVEDGETPAEALARITAESGACVDGRLIDELRYEFPGDEAVLHIKVCGGE
jgi:hypothetical protein